MNKSTICPLPFRSISYSMTGMVGPCTNCNLTEFKTIDDYWNSEELKKLRTDMINGVRNPACNECHRREDVGAWNTRQALLGQMDTVDINNPVIKDILLRFSNMCNYKCVDCSWTTSSLIYQEEIKRGILEITNSSGDKPYVINSGGDPHTLLEQAKMHVSTAENVTFSGGEPMVQWQQWELLKYMVDNNMAPNLKYYTNLSRLSYKDYNAIELWKNFKNLSIDIGIDAMGERCEYFRKNMNFDQTFKNIDIVLEEIPNSEIFAVITFTWLNAINAAELFEWLFKNKPNVKITLNQVLHPHLDIQIAPRFKKEEISKAFDKMLDIANEYNYNNIDMIVGLNNYMWSEDRSHQFREAVEWLNELDKWRDQKFTDVFTEHQNILTYLADV